MFKKKDMLLVAAVLLIAGIMAVIFYLPDKKGGNMVCVMVDGKEYGRYSLKENQTIEVSDEKGYNRIIIDNGSVYMESADCPDQYCVRHKAITGQNETIVCLPHKLVVEIYSELNRNDIDIVAE
ncbi:MAG: NusG domain II-containing protein [Lachnospiraceae bacterium]|nr:NusG domain II-containing protein [Lachnospiraceae bacterium]